jgi:hypothetical protein
MQDRHVAQAGGETPPAFRFQRAFLGRWFGTKDGHESRGAEEEIRAILKNGVRQTFSGIETLQIDLFR